MRRWLHAVFLLTVAVLLCSDLVKAQADAQHMDAGGSSSSLEYLPSAPEPAVGQQQSPNDVPWAGVVHYGLFSRVAVGADISPLGVSIKGATILNEKIDLRLMMNFLNITGSYGSADDIKDVGGTLHLASLQTAVDFYPRNSVWRLSAGLLLWNGNDISAHGTEVGGTSFALPTCPANNCPPQGYTFQTYTSDPADPFGMNMYINMHPREPAFTVSAGFGRYVPRSQRHWSFPAEYGVVFMGNPTVKFTPFGSVCGPSPSTVCSPAVDNAVFLNALTTYQQRLQRNAFDHISIWPIFSYGVMYSFNTGR